jgi:plasmid stability protein
MAELSIKNFPEDLLKRLKVQAAQEGITLRDLVVDLLGKRTSVLTIHKHKPAR